MPINCGSEPGKAPNPIKVLVTGKFKSFARAVNSSEALFQSANSQKVLNRIKGFSNVIDSINNGTSLINPTEGTTVENIPLIEINVGSGESIAEALEAKFAEDKRLNRNFQTRSQSSKLEKFDFEIPPQEENTKPSAIPPLLTEAVTKNPHSVILLDEIEKAHPEVFNVLLQVMDHGMLTDNNGRQASFRNCVLIMTTNSGAMEMSRESMGFQKQDNTTDGSEAIKKAFSPEFRNRLTSIVQFGALKTEVIHTVVDKFLTELQAQLDEKRVVLEVDSKARSWLAENGYDEKMGARPMQRLIQDEIKQKLAESILFGDLAKEGGVAKVSVKKEKLDIKFLPHEEKALTN